MLIPICDVIWRQYAPSIKIENQIKNICSFLHPMFFLFVKHILCDLP